jgi:2,4-dienoyl-CoA reductase-like NADH-dependent reductase (Old Yellow Enzyme family)
VTEQAETGTDLRADPAAGRPALFRPFGLRSVTFRNRIIVTPMCQYVAVDGHVGRWHRSHHGRFALGGVGGALVEATGISATGRITPGCLGIWDDSHVDGLREIVAIYHEQDIPVGIQLSHSGRKGSAAVPLEGAAPLLHSDPDRAWEIVAPSALPLTEGWPVPRAMEEQEVLDTIQLFAAAAARAVAAGFDFVEIHGAHGYLINSFVSPLSNRRTDWWGGDEEGRFRFPMAVATRIREIIPPTMPLFYRTSAEDGVEGGVTIDMTVRLCRELKACGVDLIDCSSGGLTGPSGRASRQPTPGYLVPYAEQIRREAEMATMAVGLIVEPRQAESIVSAGQADLVALGRQLIEEPNFAHRAARELSLDAAHDVLPPSYAFFLKRWPIGPSDRQGLRGPPVEE